MHQARAIHKLFPKGKPSVKARILSIIGVIGCISANHLIPPDMVSVGAKPELMKGKIKSGNIKPLEPSGDFEISPHSTASNEIAMFTKISKAANGMAWKFYDGKEWVDDIARSAPLAKGVSCELSPSKITGRLHAGEYLLVYQQEVNSPIIAYRTAPAPWGPFSEAHEVYFTEDVCKGCGIYTYNAKAHPHLSPAGQYLVSYNVNTVSWQMHMAHGDICRPKFIWLVEVCGEDG